ncbi:hypothetical protein [Kribbella deserti]|uniref:SH3 domain-containing protein n=1 Tax=Kribbella deserti TaxID=1926257 RepID=A0ABV6QI34_9ACTN
MRIKRSSKAAALAVLALMLVPATVPSSAGTTDAPASAAQVPALTPAEGSSNVARDGDRIILGPAPASTGSAGISQRTGIANLAETRFSAPTSAVVVGFTAGTPEGGSAEVDVRALVNGRWTEWTPAAAGETTALAAPSDVVQLRIIVIAPAKVASPWVSGVSVRPVAASTSMVPAAGIMAAPLVSRVFATREGLVGGTTANGHVITNRDHFVALPSRRGLANNGSGNYSVKVCVGGRCAFEPVWDVGPWNTKDDYWNPSSIREMWKDLPQGRPEAQAAYQNGYNGGKDQFGRTVANPAGIDLADGTFWDALKLTNNAWVDVTYLWTGDGGRGTVSITSGYLNIRNAPNSTGAIVGMAGKSAQVTVQCQTTGQSITGSQGTTNVWLRVHAGMYVSKAWINTGSHPAC